MAQQYNQTSNKGEPDEQEPEVDLRERFPDVEQDARLQTSTSDLPPPPAFEAKPPRTRAATGERASDETLKFGRAGNIKSGDLRGMGAGYMIGVSLVTSILVGAGLGWLADKFLIRSATPWGLIIGFFVGVVSGFVTMIQTAQKLNKD